MTEISVYELGKSYFAESLVKTKRASLRKSPKDIDIFILGDFNHIWKAYPDENKMRTSLKHGLEKAVDLKSLSLFIVDRSNEGSAFELKRFKALRSLLIQHFEIPENKILFLTSNKNNTSSWVKYFHWAWKMVRDINPKEVRHKADKPYKFLCLGGTPRSSKLALLLYMLHFNLLEYGMWSLGSISDSLWNPSGWMPRANRELGRLMKQHRNEVCRITPKILDIEPSKKIATTRLINNKLYEETYFSVVAETEFTDERHYVNRYTEKTYKCFFMMHPFIIAGNPFVLKNLREDGFRTFHPYINESYDKIYDLKGRMNAIMKEVQRLCVLSAREWSKLLNDINPILLHNKKLAEEAPMIEANINNIITNSLTVS